MSPSDVLVSLGPEALCAARRLAVSGVISRREFEAEPTSGTKGIDALVEAGLCSTVWIDRHECYDVSHALAGEIIKDLADDDRRQLHDEALSRRESLGVLDCGLEAAWQGQDWDRCCRIIDRWWPQLSFSTFRYLIQRVILEVPRDVIRAHRGAWYMAEYVRAMPMGGAPIDIPSHPAVLLEVTRTGEARDILRRITMAMIGRRRFHQFDEARQIADRGLPLAEATAAAVHGPSASIGAFWYLQSAITHELGGDLERASQMYRKAWSARRVDELGFCGRDVAGKLAMSSALQGNRSAAVRWLAEGANAVTTTPWLEPHLQIGPSVAQLLMAIDELDGTYAREMSDRLASVSLDAQEYWSVVTAARARRDITWGDPHAAFDLVERMSTHHATAAGSGLAFALMGVVRADALLAMGHATRAAAVLTEISATGFGVVPHARLPLLTGDAEEARARAAHALDGSLWPRWRTALLMIDSAAAMSMGDMAAATTSMTKAVDRIIDNQDLRALATVSPAVLDALVDSVPKLRDLMRSFDRTGVAPIYPDALDLVTISPREAAVLNALVGARTLDDVAAVLVVSKNTVKSQVRSLYAKLGVHNRQDLLLEARRLGFLTQ